MFKVLLGGKNWNTLFLDPGILYSHSFFNIVSGASIIKIREKETYINCER